MLVLLMSIGLVNVCVAVHVFGFARFNETVMCEEPVLKLSVESLFPIVSAPVRELRERTPDADDELCWF